MRPGDRKLLSVFALIAPLSVVWVGCEGQPERTYFDDSEGGTVGEASVDGPVLQADATNDVSSPDARGGQDSSSGGGPDTGLVDDSGSADDSSADGSANDGSASDGSSTNDGSASDGEVMDSGGTGGGDSGAKDSGGCVMNACGVCGGATCPTTGCCPVTASNPSGCQIAHDGGYDTYYDCEAVGTDDLSAAMDACTAYTNNRADCASYPCQKMSLGSVVCSQGSMSQSCICWGFSGMGKGYVDNSGTLPGPTGAQCFCPSITIDPKWN
jgi:hypothetical protein